MTINPYLYFNGNCESAFEFYQLVFRKTITYIGRYKDVPSTERHFFNETDDKIMHVTLPISAETSLTGSDNTASYQQSIAYGNCSLVIHTDTQDETDRIFNALADGGKIKVTLSLTFWGSYYGICVDKFGITWKITSAQDQAK